MLWEHIGPRAADCPCPAARAAAEERQLRDVHLKRSDGAAKGGGQIAETRHGARTESILWGNEASPILPKPKPTRAPDI